MTDAMSTSAQAAPWVLLIMAIESEFLQWIACVAYGLLAGLISRIIFLPVGLLDNTELVDRLGATVFGFVLFVIFKRNIAVGTLSAAGLFMLLVWLRTQGILSA